MKCSSAMLMKLALLGAIAVFSKTVGAAATPATATEEHGALERALLHLFGFNEEYSSLEGVEEPTLTAEEFETAALSSVDSHGRKLWDSMEQDDVQKALRKWVREKFGGDYKKAFQVSDVNGKGTLGRPDLIALASNIGNYEKDDMVASRLRNWFNEDPEKNNSLDITEFKAAAKGDPHFSTWAGRRFSYHGACDLVLIHNPGFAEGKGLDLHVRTEHMLEKKYSFMSNAALRIGEDTLEITADGKDFVNGHANVEFPMWFAGHAVNKTVEEKCWGGGDQQPQQQCAPYVLYDIILGGASNDHIFVRVLKNMVHVDVKGSQTNFVGSTGIMGTVSETPGAVEILARDGKTIVHDFEAYVKHWQVLDTELKLFQGARFPQFPDRCIPPSVEQQDQQARRLRGNSAEFTMAKEACAHVAGDDKEFCIFDVMATGDYSMAEAVYGH